MSTIVKKQYPFVMFDACKTEEQLKKILEDAGYTRVQLQEIAKRYCCPEIHTATKAKLISHITWQAVGSRLFHQALYDSFQ